MEKLVADQYLRWSSQQLKDPDLGKELADMKGNDAEIADRFYRNLEFGTGGLRGVIGAGTNRMNLYTVARATQGYCDYLLGEKSNPVVAIAHDSRIKSELFSRTAAEVFAANGIHVHIYRELMPTPSLSFAVRYLTCDGGIVLTASHNPAKYNGYKVYGADGGQITSQAAKEILEQINQVDVFENVKYLDFEQGLEQGMITYIEENTIKAYIDAVSSQTLCGEEINKDVSIVYTPLNGAGLTCVTRCLRENGFTNISVVKEQEYPDGNFPTCPYPNPEIKEALELGLRDATKLGSDLLLATDPDCDRVGIAVRADAAAKTNTAAGEYVLLTGNEVGMLLLDYICKRRIALGRMPKNPVMVKTIVTIDMAARIAADYGVEVIDVLTGFKYIGEQIGILEAAGQEERYIFGFEESYGYLSGGFVRDKDAVNGSLLICEMFAYYKTQNMSLLQVLKSLYEKYGYCLNTLHSYTFEGASGFEKMQSIMSDLRRQAPESLIGRRIVKTEDYLDFKKTGLPKSNVLKYTLEGNASVVVRPSGTEPKLKLYCSISAADRTDAVKLEEALCTELEQLHLKRGRE